MTKALEDARDRCIGLVGEWDTLLSLTQSGWHIGYVFNANTAPVQSGVAHCQADWSYQHATITFFLPEVVGIDDEELEDYIVHEFMHVMLNEMYEGDSKHEERVVSTFVRAMLKLKRK